MSWELALAVTSIAIAFAFLYLALNLNNIHALVKLGFILFGIFILITQISLNNQIVNANSAYITNITTYNNILSLNNGMFNSTLIAGILLFSYFALYFLIMAIKGVSKKE